MQESGSLPRRRRHGSHRRWRRRLRAYWPFALVLVTALLSAGVVSLVESGPPPGSVEPPRPEPPSFEGLDRLIDLELFDQGSFWDPERLFESQRGEINLQLDRTEESPLHDPDLGRVLPESFIDDPLRGGRPGEMKPESVRIEPDRSASFDVGFVQLRPNPEPSTSTMVLLGLLLLKAPRPAG